MDIGRKILELRRKENVTQDEMAAELGVTAAAVSKWENGYTLPDILMLCAIADYFGVTTDELLGRFTQRKFTIIAAESSELARQMEILAEQHGLVTATICGTYREALEAVQIHSHVKYLLVSCGKALTKEELDAAPDDIYILDSPNETTEQILAGFELFFSTLGL